MSIGQTLKQNKEAGKQKQKFPMPPRPIEDSYATFCFSKENFSKLATTDAQKIKDLFDEILKEIETQANKGITNPEFKLLSGPSATKASQLRMAAIVQNHETWQEFIQQCIENELGIECIDFTDEEAFDVRFRFHHQKAN